MLFQWKYEAGSLLNWYLEIGIRKGGSMAFQSGYDRWPWDMHKRFTRLQKECEALSPAETAQLLQECSKRKDSGRFAGI